MIQKLFVYGTLAPGRPNEHMLKNIGGSWELGSVTGTLHEKGWGATMGYPGIILDKKGDKVEGFLFSSDHLEDHWTELDEFEGDAYERILTMVELQNKAKIEAFIYTIKEENKSAEHLKRLREITSILLEEERNYLLLTHALKDYRSLLLELSKIELGHASNRKEIRLKNGIAVSTTVAAMCVNDIIRTTQFIRGIFKAVEELLPTKDKPIHILYAGSGPFATLMLPVLSTYSETEIQVSILEINPLSIESVKRVISKLGFDKYINKIECADATKYKINTKEEIDLIISETMQYSLFKEQQVPIMINLLNQLDDHVKIIPEKIKLDLALFNSDVHVPVNDENDIKYKEITSLIEFDKDYIKGYCNRIAESKDPKKLIEKTINLPEWKGLKYDRLVILTEIQVYGTEKICYGESGLTTPYILTDLSHIKESTTEINIWYDLEPVPGFEFI